MAKDPDAEAEADRQAGEELEGHQSEENTVLEAELGSRR